MARLNTIENHMGATEPVSYGSQKYKREDVESPLYVELRTKARSSTVSNAKSHFIIGLGQFCV